MTRSAMRALVRRAVVSLRAQALRSALSLLGILFGVASITTVLRVPLRGVRPLRALTTLRAFSSVGSGRVPFFAISRISVLFLPSFRSRRATRLTYVSRTFACEPAFFARRFMRSFEM